MGNNCCGEIREESIKDVAPTAINELKSKPRLTTSASVSNFNNKKKKNYNHDYFGENIENNKKEITEINFPGRYSTIESNNLASDNNLKDMKILHANPSDLNANYNPIFSRNENINKNDNIIEIDDYENYSIGTLLSEYHGLTNHGNTCFINSGLHVLYNIEFVKCFRHLIDQNIENPLISSFNKLMGKLENNDTENELKEFLREFGLAADDSFKKNKNNLDDFSFNQNDCFSFLQELLKLFLKINSSDKGFKFIYSIKKKNLYEKNIEIVKHAESNPYCIFYHSIILQNSSTFQAIPCLDISRDKKGPLRNLIMKQLEITPLIFPSVTLVIKYESMIKCSDTILKVKSSKITENGEVEFDKTYIYYLNSIVTYSGSSYSGHYWVYCRKGNKWVCFEDAEVIYDQTPLDRYNYIYIYKRKI